MLYYRFLFSCENINENATASFCPSRPGTSQGGAFGFAVLVSLPVCDRNLDVDSGFPFPCLCTVNFLIANISMTSASRLLDPIDKASKKTAHSIHASREPKSDAKLQPSAIPTKSFRQKIYYLTHFNKTQVVIYRQTIKYTPVKMFRAFYQALTWTLMPASRNR